MLPDATLLFAAVSGIILLGFLGEQFFRRTGVPSFLLLILIGILLGPVFGVFSGTALRPILGTFAELTLVMILFYSGLDMRLNSLIHGGGRAVIMVVVYVTAATVAVGLFGYLVLRWDLLQSFILGAIIGGQTSTPVVVPLAKSLKLPEGTVTLITLESVLNSILAIILFFTLTQVYSSGVASWSSSLLNIAASFSIGIVPSCFLSVAWILLLERVKDQKYTYVLTLGLLLGTYALTTTLGGSGELGVFVFGLVFGNYKLLNSVRSKKIDMDVLTGRLSGIQDEISFLLNTLFFVFLGLTFQLEVNQIAMDLVLASALVALLLGSRLAAASVATLRSDMSQSRYEITLMSAQGVTQATLAIVALELGLPLGKLFLSLVAFVIILTNLVTTFGSVWIRRRKAYAFREFMNLLNEDYRAPQQSQGGAG